MQLSIVLIDDIQEIKINVDRDILAQSCTYFNNLLTKFQEQNSTIVKLTIPYANIARDVIEQLCNSNSIINDSTDIEYQLKFYKTCVFFGIEIDHKFLENIKVPCQCFDLLLDVIDIIGYDEHTIKIIVNNLPLDYDISTFPKSLIDEMYTISTSYEIIASIDYGLTIQRYDPDTLKLFEYVNFSVSSFYYIIYLQHNNNIFLENDKDIKIVNFNNNTKKHVYTFSQKNNLSFNIAFSLTSKNLSICDGKKIFVVDEEKNSVLKTLKHKKKCSQPCYSPSDKYFAVTNYNNIIIYNTSTYKIDKVIQQRKCSCYAFTYDDQMIAIGSQDANIYIYEIKSGKLKFTLSEHNGCVKNIIFSRDGLWMVSIDNTGILNVWNAKLMILHNFINKYSSRIMNIKITPDCNQIIVSCPNFIEIYDLRSLELMRTLNQNRGFFNMEIAQNFTDEIINKIKNQLDH
ncbi:BTB/POZ domain and WD-repeat protein [Cotonvirus japonicus]|uniref:BTB/POZ domain and WD-repeat protein n=1 Tax=Cotonvirus japonicus TaxID=2811091 RepID=A0ABM7NU30_9VIRU|nr:BTB/POZ domain and WD-repeat protein [Cotonvirus japonicus]BCS83571.1 BTB/POZ domain and WD-repeat protein [Cotonvirus japonicus]